jgi:hypothetical protein
MTVRQPSSAMRFSMGGGGGHTPSRRFACIVGAPRSGTTSLSGFLRDHPDVCFSWRKEPHFFTQNERLGVLTDEALRQVVQTEYLDRYFPHLNEGHTVMAEGSVSYLYAPERLEPLLRLWPDARFIIAVRDPLKMLPSLHQRLRVTGDETVADVAKAWALQGERAAGRRIPRSCIDPHVLRYEDIGRLGQHVARFFEVVGRERCMVMVFDDLAADPADAHARLMDFLGLARNPDPDLSPRLVSSGFRSGWLQRLLKRPPVVTRTMLAAQCYGHRVERLQGARRDPALVRSVLAARKTLLDWNRAPAPPAELPDSLRRDICETLAPDVAFLSRLLGRDLGHWLDGAPAPYIAADAADAAYRRSA